MYCRALIGDKRGRLPCISFLREFVFGGESVRRTQSHLCLRLSNDVSGMPEFSPFFYEKNIHQALLYGTCL